MIPRREPCETENDVLSSPDAAGNDGLLGKLRFQSSALDWFSTVPHSGVFWLRRRDSRFPATARLVSSERGGDPRRGCSRRILWACSGLA